METRDNSNKTTKPTLNPAWTLEEVAAWARKVLRLDADDVAVLQKQKYTGQALFSIKSIDTLAMSLPHGTASILWAEIDLLKKSLAPEPDRDKEQQFLSRPATRASFGGSQDSHKPSETLRRHSLPGPTASRRVATTLQTWVDRPELTEMIKVSNYTFAGAPDGSRPPTLVISGPCGIGKTRLCLRYLELVSAETTSHPQGVQAQMKIEKADKIVDLTVVPTSSIARQLLERLNISYPKDSELTILHTLELILPDDLKKFTRKKPFKLVLYLDEIQNIGKGYIELKYAIQQLCDTHQNVRIQLVVSGIAAAFLAEEILEEPKLLELSSGPINVVHVQHLTDKASSLMLEQALNEICKMNAAKIVCTPYVKEALPWLGGNTRMIEFAAHALSSDDTKHNTEALLSQVKQLFSFKYPARVTDAKRKVEAYNCLIAACITQTAVAYKDVFKGPGADKDIHIKKFIKEGIVAFTPVPDSEKGYLSMPVLEMHIFAEFIAERISNGTLYANTLNGQLIRADHKSLTPLSEALKAHKFGKKEMSKMKKSTNEEASEKKEEEKLLEKKAAKKSNKSQKAPKKGTKRKRDDEGEPEQESEEHPRKKLKPKSK